MYLRLRSNRFPFLRANHVYTIHHLLVSLRNAHVGVAPYLDPLVQPVVPYVRQIGGLVRDRVKHRAVLPNHHRDLVRAVEIHHPKVSSGRRIVDLRHAAIGPRRLAHAESRLSVACSLRLKRRLLHVRARSEGGGLSRKHCCLFKSCVRSEYFNREPFVVCVSEYMLGILVRFLQFFSKRIK